MAGDPYADALNEEPDETEEADPYTAALDADPVPEPGPEPEPYHPLQGLSTPATREAGAAAKKARSEKAAHLQLMTTAAKSSPNEAALLMWMDDRGIDIATARRNMPALLAALEAEGEDYEGFVKKYPVMAEWAIHHPLRPTLMRDETISAPMKLIREAGAWWSMAEQAIARRQPMGALGRMSLLPGASDVFAQSMELFQRVQEDVPFFAPPREELYLEEEEKEKALVERFQKADEPRKVKTERVKGIDPIDTSVDLPLVGRIKPLDYFLGESVVNKAEQEAAIAYDHFSKTRREHNAAHMATLQMFADLEYMGAMMSGDAERIETAKAASIDAELAVREASGEQGVQRDYGIESEAGKIGLDIAEGAASQIESLGAMFTGTVVGGALGWLVGNPAGGALFATKVLSFGTSFSAEGGGAYKDFTKAKDDKGKVVDRHVAMAAAVLYGIAAAGVELKTLGPKLKGFGSVGEAIASGNGKIWMRKAMRDKTLGRAIKDLARALVESSSAEGLEEGTQETLQFVGKWAATSWSAGELQHFDAAELQEVQASAWYKGQLMGLIGLGGAQITVQAAQAGLAIQEQETSGQQIAGLVGLTKSENARKAPKAIAELVALEMKRVPGKKPNSAFINPVAFVDSALAAELNPEELANELMGAGGAEKLKDALLRHEESPGNRATLEVPMEDYLEKWGTKDIAETLEQDTALSEGGFTIAEQKNRKQDFANLTQQLMDEAPDDETVLEDSSMAEREFIAELEDQAVRSGRMDKGEARRTMAPLRAFIRTMASRSRAAADEIFRDVTVQIRSGARRSMTLSRLARQYNMLDPTGKMEARYTDRNTGLLNEAGQEAVGHDPWRPMTARFSLPVKKAFNDEHSHKVVDGALRVIGQIAGQSFADAVKRGGGIEVDVINAAQAQQLREAMQNALDPAGRMPVTMATVTRGETQEETGKLLGIETDRVELEMFGEGLIHDPTDEATRPFRPPLMADDSIFNEAAEQWLGRATGDAQVIPGMAQKHSEALRGFSALEAFHQTYQTDQGLLSELGFERAVEMAQPANVAAIDVRGLGAMNTWMGRANADAVLALMAEVFHTPGLEFSQSHLHGDEFAAFHDDAERMGDYLEAIKEETSNLLIVGHNPEKGVFFLKKGLDWEYGTSKDYEHADKDLAKRKAAQTGLVAHEEFADHDALIRRVESMVGEDSNLRPVNLGQVTQKLDQRKLQEASGRSQIQLLQQADAKAVANPRSAESKVAARLVTASLLGQYFKKNQTVWDSLIGATFKDGTSPTEQADSAYLAWKDGRGSKPGPYADAAFFDDIEQLVGAKVRKKLTSARHALDECIKASSGTRTEQVLETIDHMRRLPGFENLRLPDDIVGLLADAQMQEDQKAASDQYHDDVEAGLIRPDGEDIAFKVQSFPAPEWRRYEQPGYHGGWKRGLEGGEGLRVRKAGTGAGQQEGYGLYFSDMESIANFYASMSLESLDPQLIGWSAFQPAHDDRGYETPREAFTAWSREMGVERASLDEYLLWELGATDMAKASVEKELSPDATREQVLEAAGEYLRKEQKRLTDKLEAAEKEDLPWAYGVDTTKRLLDGATKKLELLEKFGDKLPELKAPTEQGPFGQVYKVEIPEEHELLDHSTLMKDQGESVKRAVEAILEDYPHLFDDHGFTAIRRTPSRETADDIGDTPRPQTIWDVQGDDFYFILGRELGGDKEASLYLNSKGVPGARYKAWEQYAGAKEGVHNYLIWDESRMPITETLYQGGLTEDVVPIAQRAAVDTFEDTYRNEPTETLYVVTDDAEQLVTQAGTESEVRLSPEQVAALHDAGKDAVLTHNHPRGGLLSKEDVMLGVFYDLAEVRATVPAEMGGGSWVIRRPEGGWKDDGEQEYAIAMAFNDATDAATARMDEHVLASGGNPATGDIRGYSDELWYTFQDEEYSKALIPIENRYGWRMEKEGGNPRPGLAPEVSGLDQGKTLGEQPEALAKIEAAGLSPTEEKVRNFETEHRHSDVEHAAAYDSSGNELGRVRGDKNSFTLDNALQYKLAGDPAPVLTHNHPVDVILSPQDIQLAMRLDLAEIRATTEDGAWVAKRPPAGWTGNNNHLVADNGMFFYTAGHPLGLMQRVTMPAFTDATLVARKRAEDDGHDDNYLKTLSEEAQKRINDAVEREGWGWRIEFEPHAGRAVQADRGRPGLAATGEPQVTVDAATKTADALSEGQSVRRAIKGESLSPDPLAAPTRTDPPRLINRRRAAATETGAPIREETGTLNVVETIERLEQTREAESWWDGFVKKLKTSKRVRGVFDEKDLEKIRVGIMNTRAVMQKALDAGHVPAEYPIPTDKKGKQISPLRENDDYKKTFDITTVCPKQDTFVNTVHAVEAKTGEILNKVQRYQVGLMIRDLGAQPSCWYCYGQAGRDAYDAYIRTATDVTRQAVALMAKHKGKRVPKKAWRLIFKPADKSHGWNERGKLAEWIRENWRRLQREGVLNEVKLRDLARGEAASRKPTKLELEFSEVVSASAQAATKQNDPKAWATLQYQILDWAQKTIDYVNARGGLRMNSQTDFRPWHVIEVAEALSSMMARELQAHVYTKETDFLDIFGKTGIKFNLSAFFEAEPGGKLKRDRSGRPVFDDVIGMSGKDIAKWTKKYPGDVGGMLMAQNDEALLAGLSDDRIAMVIPYHSGPVAKEVTRAEGGRDYSKHQHESFETKSKPLMRTNSKGAEVPALDKEGKQKKERSFKIAGEWYKEGEPVNLKVGKEAIKMKAGEDFTATHHHDDETRYFELVNALGATPKFSMAVDEGDGAQFFLVAKERGKWVPKHPGYFKMIKDVAKPADQKVPDATKINWKAAHKVIGKWTDEGGDITEANPAIVENVLGRIKDDDWPPVDLDSKAIARLGGELRQDDEGAAAAPAPKPPPRGFIDIIRKGAKRALHVFLTENSNMSTMLHEQSHLYLEVFEMMAEHDAASDQIKADWARLLQEYGVESGKQLTTDHKEKFARSFEQYFMEGKAPSARLVEVFHSFRLWLTKIYQQVANIPDAALNDDLRGIFDRMLATDAEIVKQRRAAGYDQPVFKTAEAAGMSPSQFKAYLEGIEKESTLAAMKARKKLAQAERNAAAAFKKGEFKELQQQATKEWDERPETRAWRYVRFGEFHHEDGRVTKDKSRGKLDKDRVTGALGENHPMVRKLRNSGRLVENGDHPRDTALVYGWEGGQAGPTMLEALANEPTKKDWVKGRAEEMMKERHPDLETDISKLDETIQEILHEDTGTRLVKELAALRRRRKPGELMAQADLMADEGARMAARAIVNSKPAGRLDKTLTLQRQESAANQCIIEAAKGNYKKAIALKLRQMLEHHTYKQIVKVEKEVRKFERLSRQLADRKRREKMGQAGPDLVDASDQILEALGIKPPDNFERVRKGVGEIFRAMELTDDGTNVDVDELQALMTTPPEKSWRNGTVGQMRLAHRALAELATVARNRTSLIVEGRRRDLESLLDEIEDEAKVRKDLGPGKKGSAFSKGKSAKAILLAPQEAIRRLGDTAYRTIWLDGYMEAAYREQALLEEIGEFFAKRWQNLPKALRDSRYDEVRNKDGVELPADVDMDVTQDRQWMWMVALNMGNKSNMERLLGGYQWDEAAVFRWLDENMTDEEWDFVEEIWTLLDAKLYPHVEKAYTEAKGLPPPKIKASPFFLKSGRMIGGGYFPAKYDPVVSRVGEMQMMAALEGKHAVSSAAISVSKGFTQGRAERYTDIIDLDWQTVPGHIMSTVKYASFDRFVRQARTLMTNARFQSIGHHYIGSELLDTLTNKNHGWLASAAGNNYDAATGALKVIEWFLGTGRSMLHMTTVAWSVPIAANALMEPIEAAFSRTGPSAWQTGKSMAKAPLTAMRWFAESLVGAYDPKKWPSMRDRAMTLGREPKRRAQNIAFQVRGMLDEIGKRGKKNKAFRLRDQVQESAWFAFDIFDRLSTTVIWDAAFNDGLNRGLDQKGAAAHADDVVVSTMMTQENAEFPLILRDRRTAAKFMIFFGYFSKRYQNMAATMDPALVAWQTADGLEGHAKAAGAVAARTGQVYGMMAVSMLFGSLISGHGPEEEEGYGEWAARMMIAAPFQFLPWIGGPAQTAAGAITSKVAHGETKWRPTFTKAAPVWSAGEKLGKAGMRLLFGDEEWNEGWDQKFWDALEIAGLLTVTPIGSPQVKKTGKYATALLAGEAQDTSPTGIASGLLFGEKAPGRGKPQEDNPLKLLGKLTGL